MSAPYAALTLAQVPRALSLEDANPRSRTYGCCDRAFWQYRTVADFPAATFQQLALAFAALASTPFPGTVHAGDEGMRERARAALRFWCAAGRRDGSFDEWYRNERSYCATAFTTFGMAETVLALDGHLAPTDRDAAVAALRRSARWLADRWNPWVMNQNLAACAGLLGAHLATGDVWMRDACARKWGETLRRLDDEGWFPEYGGADLGYATLALDLLAALDRRGAPGDVLGTAAKACRYLATFACRSGGLAERLGSRGTSHAFPYGAEAFADRVPEAAALAVHLRRGLERGELLGPAADDRYFAYFYLPQFALACTVRRSAETAPAPQPAPPAPPPPAPPAKNFSVSHGILPRGNASDCKSFAKSLGPAAAGPATTGAAAAGPAATAAAACAGAPADVAWSRSGFRVWRRAAGDVVCSLRRQGAFNVYVDGRPPHHDLGYWVETEKGERWTSARWNDGEVDCSVGARIGARDGAAVGGPVTVRGRFVRVDDDLPLVRRAVAFHVLTRTVLRFGSLAERFQSAVKRRRILARRHAPLAFERTLRWDEGALRVRDVLTALAGCPALRAVRPADDAEGPSPSARLSGAAAPGRRRVDEETARAFAARLAAAGRLVLETVYAPDASGRLAPGPLRQVPGPEPDPVPVPVPDSKERP